MVSIELIGVRLFLCHTFVVPFATSLLRWTRWKRVVTVAVSLLVLLYTGVIYKEQCRVEAQHRELISMFRQSIDGTVVMDIYNPPLLPVHIR